MCIVYLHNRHTQHDGKGYKQNVSPNFISSVYSLGGLEWATVISVSAFHLQDGLIAVASFSELL